MVFLIRVIRARHGVARPRAKAGNPRFLWKLAGPVTSNEDARPGFPSVDHFLSSSADISSTDLIRASRRSPSGLRSMSHRFPRAPFTDLHRLFFSGVGWEKRKTNPWILHPSHPSNPRLKFLLVPKLLGPPKPLARSSSTKKACA